jgi:hypothetical protein
MEVKYHPPVSEAGMISTTLAPIPVNIELRLISVVARLRANPICQFEKGSI